MIRNRIFYAIKPIIPRRLQLFIRRQIVKQKEKRFRHIWPIDPKSARPPKNWPGWPDGKQFGLILSHDVDTQKGHDDIPKLMDLEEKMGFRSSINIVPERYTVSLELIEEIKSRGFQVCVHGLYHDGKLFRSRRIFNERAEKINQYLRDWKSIGFTSPSMHHNLEWMHILNILHSTSTFDTDPFEPQPDAIRTIFPLRISNSRHSNGGYIELPYTLPQDHLLYIIMRHKNIDVWKRKLDWIVENKGMALLNTHSDYMCFNERAPSLEEYPINYYTDFLEYIKTTYSDICWHALPKDVVSFWIQAMK
jgi:hypothetical protein